MNWPDELAHFTGEIEPPDSLADHPAHCVCSGCYMESLLANMEQRQRQLRASRDTVAIRASNAGTRMLLDSIRKGAA